MNIIGGNQIYRRILLYISLFLLSALFIIPAYFTAVNSVTRIGSISTWVPKSLHFENFKLAVTLVPYDRYFLNSVLITSISVVLPLITSAIVGFAFARMQARGKKLLFTMVLATMMLPGIVTQIPTYILFNKIGLLNTFWPWILGGIGGSAFYIFIYRQFFSAIPKEMEEAARIDGCSTLRILFTIFIPISVPVIATVAIMGFNGSWGGDFLTPFMYLHEDKYPLVTALIQIGYVYPDNPSISMAQVTNAGILIFVLPIIVVFFVGQKYLIEGIITTGIKG